VQFSWLGDVYSVGGIAVGEQASVDVTTEVVDGVYGGFAQCSDCGPANDGTKWIYALQQTAGGSSAVAGQGAVLGRLRRDLDRLSAITGLGVGVLVTAIDIVGQYLVVVAKTENAYYVSQINQLDRRARRVDESDHRVCGAKTPNDMFVESPTRVYFVADGGYIYVSPTFCRA
jgi:hypothetical protein